MKKALPYILAVIVVLIAIYWIYSVPQIDRVENGIQLRIGFSLLSINTETGNTIKTKGKCLKSKIFNPVDGFIVFENTCLNKQYKADFSGNLIEKGKIGQDLAI